MRYRLMILFLMVAIVRPLGAQDKYCPDYESLEKYEVPAWFRDAKFGIFIHWGVYSVPAYINEWYPRNMYHKSSKQYEYHLKTYGSQKEFGYKDFIPMFKAEKWDPHRWADLFVKSGAKYIVPVAEHHDGFPMYNCSFTKYNAVNMGPKRDIIGELLNECHKQGLKAGVSSHRAFHWEFYPQEKDFDTYNPKYAGLYWKRRHQRWPDEDFINNWYLRTLELAVNYKPDIVWFDFYLDQPEMHDARYMFAADYYNLSRHWGKDVVLQYKYDIYNPNIGVLDIERGKLSGIRKRPWQTDTSVSYRGWGYIQNPDYKEPGLLVKDLVDIVSKNGNLLLNIGPKPDGTIPQEQQEILLKMGNWLKVNGEAIYGTRPWIKYGEGPTKSKGGAFQERNNKGGTADDYRFTTKQDTLYAICLGWPESDFKIKSLGLDSTKTYRLKIKNVSVTGIKNPVKWKQKAGWLQVEKPAKKPGDYAYAIKIETNGLSEQMARYEKSLPKEPETIYCFPGNSLRNKEGYNVRDGKLNQWEKDTVLRWNVDIKNKGIYDISVTQKNTELERYILTVNYKEFRNKDQSKENTFSDVQLGKIKFSAPGIYPLTLKADPNSEWVKKLTLQQIKLTKTD